MLKSLRWGSTSQTSNAGPSTAPAAEERRKLVIEEAKQFGMENFGNTCYANSVLQALYFCRPFRQCVEQLLPDGTIAPKPVLPPDPSPSTATLPILPSPSTSPLLHTRQLSTAGSSISTTSDQSPTKDNKPEKKKSGTSAGKSFFAKKDKKSSPETPKKSVFGVFSSSSSNGRPSTAASAPPAPENSPQPTLTPLQPVSSAPTAPITPPPPLTLYSALRNLFISITTHPKNAGVVAPQQFIMQLRKDNEAFRSTMHQDAHEFLNYLLNAIDEDVGRSVALARERNRKRLRKSQNSGMSEAVTDSAISTHDVLTNSWVQTLFKGVLTNETRCLTCETVSSREENFLDLSIDIEQNSSVSACLRQFSASEMLCQKNKFWCDRCCGLQEAEKRMKVKELPNVLALHLKRFKWQEDVQRFIKLTYRVVFPFTLRLFNTVDTTTNSDQLYELWAIVIHIGNGPHHGHYITAIKSQSSWLLFDDETVTKIDESEIYKFFGDTPGQGSGYVLFYQVKGFDMEESLKAAGRTLETYKNEEL